MNHQQLPDPPREFFLAIREAKPLGYWVKAARFSRPGEVRYIVTAPHESEPLFGSDDIEDVLDWLRVRERLG